MSGNRFCFFSYELYPINAGGCGALLYNLAKRLVDHGFEIHFVLDIAGKNTEDLQADFFSVASDFLRADVKFHAVDDLCRDLDVFEIEFGCRFEWNAWRCAHALRSLSKKVDLDYIEFFDYYGVSYYSHILKLSGVAFQATTLAVRMHTTIEMMDGYELTNWLGPDLYKMYRLESSSIKMAECLISPSDAYMREAVDKLYPNRMGRSVISPPPVGKFSGVRSYGDGQDRKIILFYGRMYGIKGVDLFVDAAIEILSNAQDDLEFYVVGGDSFQPPIGVGEYKKYLLDRIPEGFVKKFYFSGHLSHQELFVILDKTVFAVFPSYFESYGYAAREIASAGIPVVLGEAIGFRDGHFVDGVNALFCEQTVSSLLAGMKKLLGDAPLRESISLAGVTSGVGADIDFYKAGKEPVAQIQNHLLGPDFSDIPSSVVCIVTGQDWSQIEVTVSSIKESCPSAKVFVAFAGGVDGATKYLFLGRYVSFLSGVGEVTEAPQVGEVFGVFSEGWKISAEFFNFSLKIIKENAQIAAVGCWVQSDSGRRFAIAQDMTVESSVVGGSSLPSGFLMRNIRSKYLFDIFDTKALHFGEIKYLAELKGRGFHLITLPFFLAVRPEPPAPEISKKLRSYFVNSLRYEESVRCFSQLFAVMGNSELESFNVATVQAYEPLRDRLGEKNYMMLLRLTERVIAMRGRSKMIRALISISKAISKKL